MPARDATAFARSGGARCPETSTRARQLRHPSAGRERRIRDRVRSGAGTTCRVDTVTSLLHGSNRVRTPFHRCARGLAAGLFLVVSAATAWGSDQAAGQSAEALAKQAIADCMAGQKAKDRASKVALFTRGQELAEKAIKLDDDLVDAHYGRFCNLGESLRVDGEKITSVFKLKDLMNELDKTLALDPNHVEALATKGALLVQLPRLLGGDVPKGEQMLRKVVRLDDNAVNSRIVLAKACKWRGETAEGVAFAQRALQIAQDEGRADKVAEAQSVLADLGAKP